MKELTFIDNFHTVFKVNSFKVKYLTISDDTKILVQNFISEWFNEKKHITTFTSGSTGKPKEIRILKSKMMESALMTGAFLNLKKNDIAFLCLSVNSIAGKMMIVRSIVLKLNLFISSPSSNPFDSLKQDIDFIAMVPLQLENALNTHSDKLKKIKNIIIGGGKVSNQIIEKLIKNEITVFHTFGMTETISHIAIKKIGLITEDYFTAIGNTTFSEINGQLCIHSDLLDSGKITSNDSIKLIDNKHFIHKGRIDFVINTGGIKIHPEEIEIKLEKLINYPFFVIGMEDNYLGEKVVLCIENNVKIEFRKKEFLTTLNKYECPKEIYYIPKFELTELGKINRLKTRNQITDKTIKINL